MALNLTLKKRGSLTDLPFIIGGIFTVALIALILTSFLNRFDTELQGLDMGDIDLNGTKVASDTMVDAFPRVMDGAVVFIFFSLVILSLVLASLVPVHPIFLIFYLLEWIILIWLGAGIANSYEAIITNPIFSVEESQFSLTIHFFRYFPFIIGVVGAVLAIVVYKTKEKFLG